MKARPRPGPGFFPPSLAVSDSLDSWPPAISTSRVHEAREEGKRAGTSLQEASIPVLTKSYQRSQDGDEKRREEHVDVAVEARHLPCARVSQAHHVGVAMV